jgi:uridylate kinase
MENEIPILIFRFAEPGRLVRALRGEDVGTRVSARDE